MPLLGAIGNASEYSFRGTYDNYPFDIDFGDLIDAEPGQTYTTLLKLVEDINYKVPISISGDGEYYIGNVTFDKTFDNNYITLDQTGTTFDSTFPELDYSTQPTYVRNGNTVGLRIIGAPPGTEIGAEYYDKTYNTTLTIGKKEFNWSVTTKKAESAKNLSFINQNKISYSTEVVSNEYVVNGLSDVFGYTAEIISNQGLLSINNQSFVKSSTIKNNDAIRLKLTSSSLNFSENSTTLRIALSTNSTIGSATTTWTITTLDSIPSNLLFSSVNNAELKSQIQSDIITIQGLSDGVDFNISITSTDGLLSVNDSAFVKSATIKNGDQLQLRVDTTSVWLEEKTVSVKLENTSTTWKVTNRTIQANSDVYASNLIFAYPLSILTSNTNTYPKDVSQEVKVKSGLSEGFQCSTSATNWDNTLYSTEQSKYYLTSHKPKTGQSTATSTGSFFQSTTQVADSMGFSDFTMEMWLRTDSFNFSGTPGYALCRPFYFDTSNLNDYVPIIYLKGDNWANQAQFKRGVLVGYINQATRASITIAETSSQVLTLNTWNHIAITRSGSAFRIWINGILRASGSASIDFTGYRYGFFRTDGLRNLINQNTYIQDLRFYKGIAKYNSNFSTSNVTSIMEQYTL